MNSSSLGDLLLKRYTAVFVQQMQQNKSIMNNLKGLPSMFHTKTKDWDINIYSSWFSAVCLGCGGHFTRNSFKYNKYEDDCMNCKTKIDKNFLFAMEIKAKLCQ